MSGLTRDQFIREGGCSHCIEAALGAGVTEPDTRDGPTVADIAELMQAELAKLRRQKAVDDAIRPLVHGLAMASIEALGELRVAAHQVIDAWRKSKDTEDLVDAIETLVSASGWQKPDDG